MKPYEFDQDGVQVFLEDDGKEKPGSLGGHIFIRKHIYGLTREEVLEDMVVEIEKIIGLLRKAENDLIFFENGDGE